MSKKIYVVTNGMYSDFKVIAVFDNIESARFLVNMHGYNEEIEEYELNPEIAEKKIIAYKSGLKVYFVSFNKEYVNAFEDSFDHFDRVDQVNDHEKSLGILVLAKDKESAVKIASEKRTQYLYNKKLNTSH